MATGQHGEELAGQIFDILTEHEIETIGDQKAVCIRIVQLFPPQYLAKYALKAIVAQLRMCEYTCAGGPLRLNTAFLALCELAEIGDGNGR